MGGSQEAGNLQGCEATHDVMILRSLDANNYIFLLQPPP